MALTRERDITEARQLLAQAAGRGSIPLPQLTDVDLCVFAASFHSVLEIDVWQRWLALADGERTELTGQAGAFLRHRALLREDPHGGEHLVQPKLAIILNARAHPAFTGICSVPGQLRVGDLRLFGIVDEVHPRPMVLLERTTARGLGGLGRIRQYSLATVEAAAAVTADWVRVSFESDPGAGDRPRLVELYWTSAGRSLTGERLAVSLHNGQSGHHVLTHTQGSAPVCVDRPIDVPELAGYVAARLRVAAR